MLNRILTRIVPTSFSMSLLVINPNSSKSVTDNLRNILVAPPGINLEFYTAPSTAPKEIDGAQTSGLSEKIVLADLLANSLHTKYDGYLICCYSDHPLIHSLATSTSKPVLGIMQATLLYSYSNARLSRSLVLTSTSGWNTLLDSAITAFAGSGVFPKHKFEPTRALDVSVLSLSDPVEFGKITSRVQEVLVEYKDSNIDCILLGCAGMAGLDDKLSEVFPGIIFVDSVKIGVEFLSSLVRFSVGRGI